MISINENLKGKIVAITGAGGVLCSSMAIELARHGVKIAVLDLNLKNAEDVVEEIKKIGGIGIAVQCDVLNVESVQKAKEYINDKLGLCDVLLNGAGGNHPKGITTNEIFKPEDLLNDSVTTLFDMTPEGFGFVFNLNFLGTFIPSQVFMSDLIKTQGSIINISSMSSYSPMTKVPAYSAAKAAINNFTQWLAVHMADSGIRVNSIAPGFFLTQQNKKLLTNEDGSLTERSNKIITHTPMRRFGKPEDLLGTIIWLLDEEMSGFITGIVVPIDGGFMAYSGV